MHWESVAYVPSKSYQHLSLDPIAVWPFQPSCWSNLRTSPNGGTSLLTAFTGENSYPELCIRWQDFGTYSKRNSEPEIIPTPLTQSRQKVWDIDKSEHMNSLQWPYSVYRKRVAKIPIDISISNMLPITFQEVWYDRSILQSMKFSVDS